MSEPAPLLEVRDLTVRFDGHGPSVLALDGVSFTVPRNTTVALVGESGAGKSVTTLAIMRLLPHPAARIVSGEIAFEGEPLLQLSERRMRSLRGARMALIFQDPVSALNPLYTVGAQLVEAYRIHRGGSRRSAHTRALELLERAGFPEPDKRFDAYPHELSGGMCQRVMIAMALCCEPALLIADEPTTSLDTLAAAQIGALLRELEEDRQMSLLLISHDLTAVAQHADEVVVLYAGQVVEQGAAGALLTEPEHPYTRALLDSVPPLRLQRRRRRPTPTRLPALPTVGGSRTSHDAGCRFAARCPEVMERCHEQAPVPYPAVHGGTARCFAVESGAVPLTRALSARPPDGSQP